MTAPYAMRRAKIADHGIVMNILECRQDWLIRQGLDQWKDRDFRATMRSNIEAGLTWLLFNLNDEPVGTITLSTFADADFWSPAEASKPAMYITKMATHPREAGRQLGKLLVNWARRYALESAGIMWLKWDAWRTNEALLEYYRSLGAKQVRTVSATGRRSGALFEIFYTTDLDDIHRYITTNDNLTEINLPSLYRRVEVLADDPDREDREEPGLTWNATHTVETLIAPNTSGSVGGPPRPFSISCGNDGLIWHPGNGWHIETFWGHPITSWINMPQLVPGQPYRLLHKDNRHGPCGLVLTGYQPQQKVVNSPPSSWKNSRNLINFE